MFPALSKLPPSLPSPVWLPHLYDSLTCTAATCFCLCFCLCFLQSLLNTLARVVTFCAVFISLCLRIRDKVSPWAAEPRMVQRPISDPCCALLLSPLQTPGSLCWTFNMPGTTWLWGLGLGLSFCLAGSSPGCLWAWHPDVPPFFFQMSRSQWAPPTSVYNYTPSPTPSL